MSNSPVTVPEALDHLRLNQDVTEGEGLEVERMLEAATVWTEQFCRRRWLSQTLTELFDSFPVTSAAGLRLPGGPVSSVTSVTYYDSTPTQQTWDSANYRTLSPRGRTYLYPAIGQTWPTDCAGETANIAVTYTAGEGTSADVPAAVKSAILLVAASLYEYREDGIIDNAGLALVNVPVPARMLLTPYKVSL